jgi:hypothetical protein
MERAGANSRMGLQTRDGIVATIAESLGGIPIRLVASLKLGQGFCQRSRH